jgi:hypothetical protein
MDSSIDSDVEPGFAELFTVTLLGEVLLYKLSEEVEQP